MIKNFILKSIEGDLNKSNLRILIADNVDLIEEEGSKVEDRELA